MWGPSPSPKGNPVEDCGGLGAVDDAGVLTTPTAREVMRATSGCTSWRAGQDKAGELQG